MKRAVELAEILLIKNYWDVFCYALHHILNFEIEIRHFLKWSTCIYFRNLFVDAFCCQLSHINKIELNLYKEFSLDVISVNINFNFCLEIADVIQLNLLIAVSDDKCSGVERAI